MICALACSLYSWHAIRDNWLQATMALQDAATCGLPSHSESADESTQCNPQWLAEEWEISLIVGLKTIFMSYLVLRAITSKIMRYKEQKWKPCVLKHLHC